MTLLKFLVLAAPVLAQETVPVITANMERKLRLPGELAPYQQVSLSARVQGFVEKVEVDRGSVVKKGQLLVLLSAPEMDAQIAEIEAKAQAIESNRAEMEAKLAGAVSAYEHLKAASATPGVVAGNELIQAEKQADAIRGAMKGLEGAAKATRSSSQVIRDMKVYLQVTAPFDGVVTERLVHPGALAGPNTGALLKIEQQSRLRLIVPVPETEYSSVARGASVAFKVPDNPTGSFSAVVARIPRSLDAKTRTMPVELDVNNPNGALAPGMYAEVQWPFRKARPSLMVPVTAVVTTTERNFVIRDNGGKAEWVTVSKGVVSGESVEVFGDLKSGDRVVKRATDEIREGAALKK